ncbi:MAG TPA: TetR/AcrR family transcriptional regulator [Polyangiaceae bacterium]|nr:TetR/AcrR family transcriptional regulator [Polyangiaceae bacterium]
MMELLEKKWRRRREARPGELTQAALGLFVDQGFAATRLEDVAARAGVSKATIYRYFENKEALFEAVVQEAIVPPFHQASLLIDAYEGNTEDLLRTFFNIVKAGLSGPIPPMIKLVISESGNFPQLAELWVELVAKRVFGIVGKIVERGVTSGEFRPVSSELIAPLVGAPVLMLAMVRQTFSRTSFALDAEAVLNTHLDMLLRGLKKTAEGDAT